MSSSKVVTVMALLILVFMFGGLLLSIILQTEGFLDNQSNRVTVNNPETFSQLAAHVALRAYHCNYDGGGQVSGDWLSSGRFKAWGPWKAYIDYAESHSSLTFEDLRNSKPGQLSCSGTAASLPFQDATLKQGASNFNPVQSGGGWGNDQEGKFSRMKFKFNKSLWLTAIDGTGDQHGCYAFNTGEDAGTSSGGTGPGGITPFVISLSDSEDFAAMELNSRHGGDPIYENGGWDCLSVKGDSIVNPDDNGDDQTGAWIHMIIMSADHLDPDAAVDGFPNKGTCSSCPVPSVTGYSQGGASGNTDLLATDFYICKGATGYIQANTGPPQVNYGIGSSISTAEYTPENPPGKSGEQVGGTQKTENYIRLFAVFTDIGDC
jgi:hypothetical protein